MTYTPTREEFELVAEMVGADCAWEADGDFINQTDRLPWTPHLPGADCMELMAAIEPDIMFHAWPEVCVLAPSGVDICASHNNTTADKARALAEAVFQCAVQVARARKESKQ